MKQTKLTPEQYTYLSECLDLLFHNLKEDTENEQIHEAALRITAILLSCEIKGDNLWIH